MNHKVTALTLQKHNRQRVNVHLDGDFAFGLARIIAAWLHVGQEISDEKIAELKAEDEREVAYEKALRLLSYRPRSESEIRQNLKKKGLGDETIEAVMSRLDRAGLVNDEQFAQAWVQNRSDSRPRSRRALSFELHQRGVPDEVIQDSLDEIDDDELAYKAASRQARKFDRLEWQEFRQKMLAFLARRGFSYGVSNPAASRVWAELHGGDPQGGDFSDEIEDS